MDQWFKIQRAREEIERLNIEIRRVVTHIRDERTFLQAAEQDALTAQPPDVILAFQIRKYREERDRFSALHLQRFEQLASTPGFTGTLAPGKSLDPTLQSRGQASDFDNEMEVDEGGSVAQKGRPHAPETPGKPDHASNVNGEDEEEEEEEEELEEEELEARLQVVMTGMD